MELIHTITLIETVELISTPIEVLIILLNAIYRSGGAYYNIKPYLRLVPTAGAGAGRGAH